MIPMELAGGRKGPQRDARMAASKRFGGYWREERRMQRAPLMRDDKTHSRLMEVWRSYDVKASHASYELADSRLEGFDCSPEEIQRFCIAAKRFEEEPMFQFKLGGMLSALMNRSSHHRHELSLTHLDILVAHLCEGNTKDVRIRGDVAESFALGMAGGSIHLVGNAYGDLAGGMADGTVTVHGEVGNVGNGMSGGEITVFGDVITAGLHMDGGSIVVHGDCTDLLGKCMRGGEIRVEGGIPPIHPSFWGGKIIHKGKVKKEK